MHLWKKKLWHACKFKMKWINLLMGNGMKPTETRKNDLAN